MSELGVNRVVLVGRAGGNAELKFTPGGKPVASFSLAVKESFKSRDGEKNDRVEWFRCLLQQIGRNRGAIRHNREATVPSPSNTRLSFS